jgi:hypothetical protein
MLAMEYALKYQENLKRIIIPKYDGNWPYPNTMRF